MSTAITVSDLGKRFRRYGANRPRSFKESLIRGLRGVTPTETFWALKDVSFSVEEGRMVGVIGHNGAGKSTLLRLVGGIGRPDRGEISVRGRIGGLLELGAGFHPDLTGRENVYVNGVVAGLTRREVSLLFDEIVCFAELEEFIDSPLHTYSDGMRMRLGFAVIAHTEPGILLIDELLAVGDSLFRSKCLERINLFRARGCTILLVSHDLTSVGELCDEVLWLHRGQLAAAGGAEDVTALYERHNQEQGRGEEGCP